VPPRRDAAKFIETFGALKRCLNGLASQAYAASELGTTQVQFLRHIGQHAPLSQADLSRATVTDPALTGRALQTLIERGWVLRERSAHDRREYLLDLGPSGRRTLKRIEAVRMRLIERLVAPLDGRDLDDFERIAGKILTAFGQAPVSQPVAAKARPAATPKRGVR
jgi:DNA-binding MarR family transcriptional regulator